MNKVDTEQEALAKIAKLPKYKKTRRLGINDMLPEHMEMRKDGTIVNKDTGRILAGAPQDTNKNGTAGAPTKYKPQFLDDLKIHMRSGGSLNTFVGYLVNKYDSHFKKTIDLIKYLPAPETVYNWADPESKAHIPEFSQTHKILQKAYEFYWKDAAAKSDKIPHAKWKFSVQNRFGWTEKKDVTSAGKAIEGPVVYTPEKHKTIDGVVIEDQTDLIGDGS